MANFHSQLNVCSSVRNFQNRNHMGMRPQQQRGAVPVLRGRGVTGARGAGGMGRGYMPGYLRGCGACRKYPHEVCLLNF